MFFFNTQKDREDKNIPMRNSATQLLAFDSISYATTVLPFWLCSWQSLVYTLYY